MLAECPFCQETGEIYLDTREADQERLRLISAHDFDAGADQKIILYNSNKAERGPCEHVVDLYGDITWAHEPAREVCFGWRAPFVAVVDPDGSAFRQLLDELESVLLQDNQPWTEYSYDQIQDCWQDFTAGIEPRRFQVQGKIIFARDMRQLFEELHAGREKRKCDSQAN